MSECGAVWEASGFSTHCTVSVGHAGAHMGTSHGLAGERDGEGFLITYESALGTIIWPKVVAATKMGAA